MKNAYSYLASCRGKKIIKTGWKASGITDAIHETCSQQVNDINIEIIFGRISPTMAALIILKK